MVEVFIEDIFSWDSKFETCFYSNRLLDKLNSRNTAVSNPVDIQGVKKAALLQIKFFGSKITNNIFLFYRTMRLLRQQIFLKFLRIAICNRANRFMHYN